jgi:branched-chain amino acid transport system permease protein
VDSLLKRFWPVLVIGVALLPPLVIKNVYYVQLLGFIGIFSLLAIGLNLVVGIADTFSLGHHAFYALGAYTSALLSTRLGVSFWLALPAAAIVAAFFGLLVGPVMRLRGPFLAVATLAFGEIVRLLALNWISLTNGPNGIPSIPWPQLGPYSIDNAHAFYYFILAAVVLEYFVILRIINSRPGRAMKAMRDNEEAAQASGVFVAHYKVLSFVIAAFFAGMAGSLYAHFISFVSPDAFTLGDSIDMLFMIVLGGLGSVPGSILGAAIVAFLPEVLRPLYEVRLIVYSILIILILTFAPKGLWGLVEQARSQITSRLPADQNKGLSTVDNKEPAR